MKRAAPPVAPIEAPEWFIIEVIGGREYAIADRLRHRAIGVWLPECRLPCGNNHRRRTAQLLPFVPGYLFIAFPMRTPCWEWVFDRPGVLAALGAEGVPLPVRDRDMVKFQRQLAALGGVVPVADSSRRARLDVGDRARIIDGPFTNFEAWVVSVDYEADRIVMSVELFGRSNDIELAEAQVEPA